MNSPPRITLLLPLYNAADFLVESIESILCQTFTDFELLIIDDGSTDGSYELAESISDSRIRLIRLNENQGLISALNLGLTQARGEFIARMDADDISLPYRLARQTAFMDFNASVGICGCWLQTFSGRESTLWPAPLSHNEIHARLLFESAIYHATAFIRRSQLDNHFLHYVDDFPFAEDYELWSRCVSHCRLANIGEVLYHYRINHKSVDSLDTRTKHKSADKVRLRWLRVLGMQPSSDDCTLHHQISMGLVPIPYSTAFLERSHAWLLKIQAANAVVGTFPEPELTKELSNRWFIICSRSTSLGPAVIAHYLRSPLSRTFSGKKRDMLALAAKSVLFRSGR